MSGVGNKGGIYTIKTPPATTDIVVTKASQFQYALSGAHFGVDCNPAADRLRVISYNGQNLRHNLNDHSTIQALSLTTPPIEGTAKGVSAAAYTNNDLSTATAGVPVSDEQSYGRFGGVPLLLRRGLPLLPAEPPRCLEQVHARRAGSQQAAVRAGACPPGRHQGRVYRGEAGQPASDYSCHFAGHGRAPSRRSALGRHVPASYPNQSASRARCSSCTGSSWSARISPAGTAALRGATRCPPLSGPRPAGAESTAAAGAAASASRPTA